MEVPSLGEKRHAELFLIDDVFSVSNENGV
jgi:hypothetical protein